MIDDIEKFLQSPTGTRYDQVIYQINVAAAKKIFSRLEKNQQADLVTAGVDALGQSEWFYQWLWTTIVSEDAKPIDLIARGEIKKVMYILGRIQYGVYG